MMVKKMPLRDMEGDDDELEDSDCLPQLLDRSDHVVSISSYFAHVLTSRGIYSRTVYISLSSSNRAAFIRGWHLFAEIR